jgi:hypothetical protein
MKSGDGCPGQSSFPGFPAHVSFEQPPPGEVAHKLAGHQPKEVVTMRRSSKGSRRAERNRPALAPDPINTGRTRTVEPNAPAIDPEPVGAGGIQTAGPNRPKIDPEPITGGETEWSYLTWFRTGAEGCKVRYQIEQKYYELSATQPNYNALFSLLLACWTNHYKVQITYKNPIRKPTDPAPDTNEPVTYPIESVFAMNMTSDDLGQ